MLGLDFDLRLEERSPDRVLVSVLLAPHDGDASIEGVALQLFGPDGDPLSARMLLPISGRLQQPMLSTLELRPHEGDIPQGGRVVGTAWAGTVQLETTVPTDPFTELEVHMRARRRIDPVDDQHPRRLTRAERSAVAHDFPWIDEPRLPSPTGALEIVDHEDEQDFEDLVDDLEIDEASASWLRELLDEDENAGEE